MTRIEPAAAAAETQPLCIWRLLHHVRYLVPQITRYFNGNTVSGEPGTHFHPWNKDIFCFAFCRLTRFPIDDFLNLTFKLHIVVSVLLTLRLYLSQTGIIKLSVYFCGKENVV